MGVPPKMIGANRNPNIVPGGFRIQRPRKTILSNNPISTYLHNEIKEAARRVLSRRP